MKRLGMRTTLAAVSIAAMVFVGLGTTSAYAGDSGASTDSNTVTISGQTLGPKEGLSVVTESFVITPGGGTVGATYTTPPEGMSTQDVWGSSYAYSQEVAYVSYVGRGKAAANVYNGLRIVKVCFWWTQDTRTSQTYCASATFSNGQWFASPEVTGSFTDSLDSGAPSTVFHIQTSRIDPHF